MDLYIIAKQYRNAIDEAKYRGEFHRKDRKLGS